MIDATKEIADEIEQPFLQNLEEYDNENETICQSLCRPALWKLAVYAFSKLTIIMYIHSDFSFELCIK